MDDHTDPPASPGILSRPFLILSGPPLLILLAGILITAIAAQTLGQDARKRAQRLVEAQHSAIVNAVALASDPAPGSPGFNATFTHLVPDQISVRIDALQQHTQAPVFEVNTGQPRSQDHTLRSEIALASGQWLVTSIPDRAVFDQWVRKSVLVAWVSGALLSLVGSLVCLIVGLRWYRQLGVSSAIRGEHRAQKRHLSNIQTEKRILRKALNDSEQRSRDLVSLSGAIVCELDEQGRTGYVSLGVAEVLGFAPEDLADIDIPQLIAEDHRELFQQTLNAARQDRQLQRVELSLNDVDQRPVPVTLRVLPLHDTLHGFSGFRLTMQPRPDAG